MHRINRYIASTSAGTKESTRVHVWTSKSKEGGSPSYQKTHNKVVLDTEPGGNQNSSVQIPSSVAT